jgi:hypothetical protein
MTEYQARKREEKKVRKPSDKATVAGRDLVMPALCIIPVWAASDGHPGTMV